MCYIPKPANVSDEDWNAYWLAWDNEWSMKNKIQNGAIAALGYVSKYGTDKERGPYLAPNGITYLTADEYRRGYGKMPAYIKDGVWYGWWETIEKHGLQFEMKAVCPASLLES